MRWTVLWTDSAQAELANIWMAAADQQSVTDSTDRIDRALAVDAQIKGIPFGSSRAYSDTPLAVLYKLDPGDCKATIIAVKFIG